MGLASSQARLLNLTSRMHQIEYKAAKLEAEKLQMANESSQVYETYLEALEKTKVQYKVLSTDGSVTYHDINNYNDFVKAGYALNYNGRVFDGTESYIDNNNYTGLNFDDIAIIIAILENDEKYNNSKTKKIDYFL